MYDVFKMHFEVLTTGLFAIKIAQGLGVPIKVQIQCLWGVY